MANFSFSGSKFEFYFSYKYATIASSKKASNLGSAEVGSKLVSRTIHDQLEMDFACWVFSTATMLHNSVRLLVKKAFEDGKIDQRLMEELTKNIDEKSFHQELRSELLLVVFPINMKPKDFDSEDQVDTGIVIERVSF